MARGNETGPRNLWALAKIKMQIAMGVDFIRELVKQEPVVIRDRKLQVDWIAKGKYPLLAAPQPDEVADYMRLAVPISYLTPQEGTYLSGTLGNVAFFKPGTTP